VETKKILLKVVRYSTDDLLLTAAKNSEVYTSPLARADDRKR
jgi:hypothetical protein